jgi:hypothetical protein
VNNIVLTIVAILSNCHQKPSFQFWLSENCVTRLVRKLTMKTRHIDTPGAARPCHAIMFIGALLIGMLAHASEADEIVTDRPDFVESSAVVGNRMVQFETSVAQDWDRAHGLRERNFSTPSLLRVGISDSIELRLETDGHVSTRTDNGTTRSSATGFADTSLGVKWHALDARDNMPSVGFLAHLDLASGSRALRGDGVRPSLRMVAEWDLPFDCSLGIMPGISRGRDDDGQRFIAAIFGIVLGKAWTDQVRTFVELAAPQLAAKRHGGTVAALTIGAAYLVSRHWQVDTALSAGLTKQTPDLSWTIGLSTKF